MKYMEEIEFKRNFGILEIIVSFFSVLISLTILVGFLYLYNYKFIEHQIISFLITFIYILLISGSSIVYLGRFFSQKITLKLNDLIYFESNVFFFKKKYKKFNLSNMSKIIFHKRSGLMINFNKFDPRPDYFSIRIIFKTGQEELIHLFYWEESLVSQMKDYLKNNYKNLDITEDYDEIYHDIPKSIRDVKL